MLVVAIHIGKGPGRNCTELLTVDPVHPYSAHCLCRHLEEWFGMGIRGPDGLHVASPQLPKAWNLGKTYYSISLFDVQNIGHPRQL